jgi:lysyl-tRNA synthetase class 2
MLRRRAGLLRCLRQFFDDREFIEVETPLLSRDTVVDRHIDPVSVDCLDPSGNREVRWLQTSPEFAMKRLLAAGEQRIYQIARAFRSGERGALHNPEFTMLEWYRVGDRMKDGVDLLCDLIEHVTGRERPQRISFAVAFQSFAGVDPHRDAVDVWREAAQRLSLVIPESLGDDVDDWIDLFMVEVVEPRLRELGQVVVYDYPASQCALAQVRIDSATGVRVAERFELYLDGVEVANGYHELLDPVALASRNCAVNQQRAGDHKPPLPAESQLVAAMEAGLPPSVGVALGVDRLLMVLAGAANIDQVIAFPWDRA